MATPRIASPAAIREPALRFGYGYAPECFERMVEQLTKEEKYVEPGHLRGVELRRTVELHAVEARDDGFR